MLRSAPTSSTSWPQRSIEPPNGITATAATAATTEIIGASWKRILLAPWGTKSSLKISFTTSASGCM